MSESEPCCGSRGDGGPMGSASIVQILTGHMVEVDSEVVRCTGCDEVLVAGDIVFAYAARCVEACRWTVPRLYCVGCAPSEVISPTLGVTEALLGGRLGTQSSPSTQTHEHCLVELALRDWSSPNE
jgi:hypothetical protein